MQDVQHLQNRALAALNARNFEEAERLFRQVLKSQPDNVAALNLLTIVLMSVGRFAEAEKPIAKAVGINATSDVSFYNYGLILKQLQRPQEALEQFGRALHLNPRAAETWNNRGTIYSDLRQYEAALADFDKAIELNRHYADACANKGRALAQLHRRREALAAYARALEINPRLAEAWIGRGNVLARANDYAAALAAYERAAQLRPDLAQSWLGQANVLGFLRRFDEAEAAYDKALSIKPDLADAWLVRGNLLGYLRRFDEAVLAYEKAYRIDPDLPELAGNLFFCRMQCCDWRNYEAARTALVGAMHAHAPAVTPFIGLSVADDPDLQLDYATAWASILQTHVPAPAVQPNSGDKIRLGYISGDLRSHPVGYLMAGVFESHDRSRFDTVAISVGHDDGSAIRARLCRGFDRFVDANGKGDAEVVQIVRDEKIDILVDLMGYTEGARTHVLAARPAPIQVNYLGYPGTLGADYMDYIIADRVIAPPSHAQWYREKIAYLPRCYLPNDDVGRFVSDRRLSRAELGLPDDAFVFCCFNNAYKINPSIFRTWMNVMKTVSHSVLWLSAMPRPAGDNLRAQAEAAGIDPQRLVFAGRMDASEDHLARHRLADLFLDTAPYNAHTTASDALLAGLPVLTRCGNAFASRVAASLLSDLGLPELITSSEAEYEALAIELAQSQGRLAGLKAKLAANAASSLLFDTKAFTRDLERVFLAMYDRHRAGMPPDHIAVEAAGGAS